MKKRVNRKINNKETKKEVKKQKISKFLFWSPRILSILFLLFLAMFSLDIFDGNYGFWGTILGLFMHNLPVIVLAILLWISWKREWVGAVTFALAGILYISLILYNIIKNGASELFTLFWTLPISLPCFVVAFLWYLNWKRKR